VKVSFGDLPVDAQEMLTTHLRVDFRHCDFKAPRWFSAWARNDLGHIIGIFAIEFPFWFEGRVTIMVLDPRCMSRRVLRAIFTAAFTQARRLTAEVEPDNRRALRQVQRLGFVIEGVRRLGLEGSRDTITFGMLKHECRFLPGYAGPTAPVPDIPDRAVRDAEAARERAIRLFGIENLQHLNGRQLGMRRHEARPVEDLIGHVAFAGVPADMPLVDAGAEIAAMRGFVPRRR
jgi:hypothetical protein